MLSTKCVQKKNIFNIQDPLNNFPDFFVQAFRIVYSYCLSHHGACGAADRGVESLRFQVRIVRR